VEEEVEVEEEEAEAVLREGQSRAVLGGRWRSPEWRHLRWPCSGTGRPPAADRSVHLRPPGARGVAALGGHSVRHQGQRRVGRG